jgi:diacylglycerol kinase
MKRIASFKYAFAGVVTFFSKDINGRIELAAATAVIIAGFIFNLAPNEWIAILLCIGAVLSIEMINAGIEKICDMIQPEYHPQIKIIKDIAAGAVLVSAVVSLIIALIIFTPKISSFF